MRTLLVAVGFVSLLHAQRPGRAANPLAGNAEAAIRGEKLYLSRCAPCHGKDARGGEGPSLFRSRIVISSPAGRFFDVLKNGIAGTEMAPANLPDEQIWEIVTYVHSQARPGQGPPLQGDVEAGRKLFEESGCAK